MKKTLLIVLVVLLIGLGVLAFVLLSGNGRHTYHTVERGTFQKIVEVSGKVAPITEASLGFQSSGIVSDVYVDVGDEVVEDDVLVEQDRASLEADLASAQASALIAGNDLENAQINLMNVVSKQNALVENAWATLLSDDLEAEARDSGYNQTPPTISGRYNGVEEGTYKIVVDRDNTKQSAIQMSVFGIEEASNVEISKTGPTALGTKGLFVSFPDSQTSYSNTVWFIDIPNTDSSSYTANLNAYQAALEERENAIQSAEDELRFQNENLSIAEAERIQAQANIQQIEVQLSQSKITAPFEGIVTLQEAEVGEVAQAGETIVELIGAEGLKLEVFVPEVNIAGIALGQKAEVVLDAYGPGEVFEAEVVKIDPKETLRDGISTYKTTFYFSENEFRIKSGMTADVSVVTDQRENVLLLPRRAVVIEGDASFVFVDRDGDPVKTEVQTGLNDSFGNTEVLAGLEEGAVVITNPER